MPPRHPLSLGIGTALLIAGVAMGVHAQEAPRAPAAQDAVQAPAADDGIRTEAPVLVVGEQPGPGLWLVRKGEHELYILGTLSPLPAKLQWRSGQVERVIAQAQEVIRPPRLRLELKTGWFRNLLLLPSLLAVRKDPQGRTLQQQVSPEVYARWQVLKARYIGSDAGIESWRPLFAAGELYRQAIRKSGLDQGKGVQDTIARAIEAHHPNVTLVEVAIPVSDPKALIKEFNRSTLDDRTCFANTIARIETELGSLQARANAWASGDLAALRALPVADNYQACLDAVSEAGVGQKLGFRDAQRQLDAKWLAAAESALARNRTTFAMVDMGRLLAPDGYLARLRAKGYSVIAPDAEDDEEPAAAP